MIMMDPPPPRFLSVLAFKCHVKSTKQSETQQETKTQEKLDISGAARPGPAPRCSGCSEHGRGAQTAALQHIARTCSFLALPLSGAGVWARAARLQLQRPNLLRRFSSDFFADKDLLQCCSCLSVFTETSELQHWPVEVIMC